MEIANMRPAELDTEALLILQEAESTINRDIEAKKDPSPKIFLIAMNSSQ